MAVSPVMVGVLRGRRRGEEEGGGVLLEARRVAQWWQLAALKKLFSPTHSCGAAGRHTPHTGRGGSGGAGLEAAEGQALNLTELMSTTAAPSSGAGGPVWALEMHEALASPGWALGSRTPPRLLSAARPAAPTAPRSPAATSLCPSPLGPASLSAGGRVSESRSVGPRASQLLRGLGCHPAPQRPPAPCRTPPHRLPPPLTSELWTELSPTPTPKSTR